VDGDVPYSGSASDGYSMEMEVLVSETAGSGVEFRARLRNSRWQVELYGPSVFYTLDEAAQAIALVHPDKMPRRLGRRTCHAALREAATSGKHGKALEHADPKTAEVYRTKLLEFGIFPAEATGVPGTKASEAAGRGAEFQARLRGLKWQVELHGPPVFYTLDEAAQAIALIHPERMPLRMGRKTCHAALRVAAKNGKRGKALKRANPEMAELYRSKLLEFEIFPPEAAGGSKG
jgi:hypothetical protein